MRRYFIHIHAATLAFVLTGAAGAASAAQAPAADPPSQQEPAKATPDAPTFAKRAAAGTQAVMDLSMVAIQDASSDAVKDLAHRLRSDHKAILDELNELAAARGVEADATPSSRQIAAKAALEKLSGAAFDRGYVEALIKGHERAIAAFERQAADGMDPELKAFAAKTVPMLKEHLQMLQEAQTSLSSISR